MTDCVPLLHVVTPRQQDVKDALVDFFSARGVNDELAAFIEVCGVLFSEDAPAPFCSEQS